MDSRPRAIPVLDLGPELDSLASQLREAFERVLASRQFILGPEVESFESEVAKYLGAEYAIGVNSGTDALVIALRAAGVGPGDEVITVPFTFFATAEAISAVGATPVFVDVEPDGLTLNPDKLGPAVSDRTKAIIPVHLYGLAADLDRIMTFAQARGLAVVEDTAQALGGIYRGRRLGTLGLAGAYSFFPSKNLGGLGDGGLIATNDARVAREARMLRVHGAQRKYQNEAVGYNSRLDALQAAFLRVKLSHVDSWNSQRREAAARYRALLGQLEGVRMLKERPEAEHVYHQFTIRVEGGRRDHLAEWLTTHNIGSMVYYPNPVHLLPVYAGAHAHCPESEKAAKEVLSLPLWPTIAPSTQEEVAERIRQFLTLPGREVPAAGARFG